MKREFVSFIADVCIIAAVLAVFVKLLLGSVVSVLLPFLIAYPAARLIRKPAYRFSKRTGIPIGLVSAVMLASLIFALCALLWIALNRLMTEAGELLARFAESDSGVGDALSNLLSRMRSVSSMIPALDRLKESEELSSVCTRIDELVHGSVNNFLEGLSNDIGNFIRGVIKALPETFLYILVTIIAAVYICSQMDTADRFLIGLIPEKYRDGVKKTWGNVISALKGYFKAYSVIYLITFAELFLGFSLMRMRSAFTLALITATVDILPVFGVGAVLLPWALFELLLGHGGVCAGLIVLYVLITVVRQISEPKIIGKSLGVSPLVALFTVFAGYKLFGVLGMILSPVAAVALFSGRGEKKDKSDEKSD